MNLKETSELVSIWVKNDRSEWTSETFNIIQDILVERLGDVPTQDTHKSTRRRRKVVKVKSKIPLEIFVFSPMLVAIILILIALINQQDLINQLFIHVFLAFLALGIFLPGLYFGWNSWFRSEKTIQRIISNLPKNKKSLGIFYRIYTLFLPERYVPTYFLYTMRFMSLAFLYGGLMMFLILIELL